VLAFNFFPGWVAIFVFHGSEGTVYPLLTPAFNRYLPLLNTWWFLAVILNMAVLRQGRWTRTTRWADLALEVFNAAILLLIVTGPPVFRYDVLIKVVLRWFIIFSAIKACVMLYRLVRRRPAEPWRARESAGREESRRGSLTSGDARLDCKGTPTYHAVVDHPAPRLAVGSAFGHSRVPAPTYSRHPGGPWPPGLRHSGGICPGAGGRRCGRT